METDQAFPKTHDLEALAKQTSKSIPELTPCMEDLAFLTSSSVEVRYPGSKTDAQDAERCFRAVKRIRDTFRQTFKIA